MEKRGLPHPADAAGAPRLMPRLARRPVVVYYQHLSNPCNDDRGASTRSNACRFSIQCNITDNTPSVWASLMIFGKRFRSFSFTLWEVDADLTLRQPDLHVDAAAFSVARSSILRFSGPIVRRKPGVVQV